MGEVDVPNVEPRPLPGQSARPQRRKPPLVGQLRQGVGLVHELGKLGPSEKLPHRCNYRPDVHQPLGSGYFRIHQGHLFLHHALHAQQTDAHLVLHQFAHRPDPAVAQVVNIVGMVLSPVELDDVTDDLYQIVHGQHMFLRRVGKAEAAV